MVNDGGSRVVEAGKASNPDIVRSRKGGIRGTYFTVAILSGLSFVSLLDRQVFSLAVEPMKVALGFSDLQIGAMQGLAFAVSYTISGLLIGWLVDRYPRRPILFLGVLLFAFATAATGLAHTLPRMFAARVAVGLGEAAPNPCSFTIMADIFPGKQLTLPMSVYSVSQIAGAGLSIIAGGMLLGWITSRPPMILPLVGLVAPWQLLFLAAAVPAFIGAILVLLLREPKRSKSVLWRGQALTAFLSKQSALISCHFTGFTAIQLMLATAGFWNLPYMARTFGWSPVQVGIGYGIMMLVSMIGGNLITGRLIDRRFESIGRAIHFNWYASMALLSIPFVLASYWTQNALVFLILTGFYSALLAGFPAAAAASLQILSPYALRGRMTALYMMVGSIIGLGVGPVAIGLLNRFAFADDSKLGASLSIIAVTSLLSAAIALRIGARFCLPVADPGLSDRPEDGPDWQHLADIHEDRKHA